MRVLLHPLIFAITIFTAFIFLLQMQWIQDRIAFYVHTHQTDVPEASIEDYRALSPVIAAYLADGSLAHLSILTEQEATHMRDVKNIFDGIRVAWLACVALLAAVWLRMTGSEFKKLLKTHAIVAPLCIVVGAGLGLVFFEQAFIKIHQILFSNHLWLLDPAQHILIRAYPPLFFQVFFATWISAMLVVYVALYMAVRRK